MVHEVGVGAALLEHAAHALEYVRVDVSGNVPKVGGNLALDLRDVEQVALVVNLVHHPDVAGYGHLLAGRRHSVPISVESERTVYSTFSWKTAKNL